ncbi:unnamed protein product [Mytilus coruscus]|uniref:Integrase catalytic domain-containing protein n=1 Tax=Mytilus coruscus TaxID=42192 RepID=A0A6J8BJ45_MYTCO|nr:unnamed protein product [Mytilus coruscus]
MEQNRYYHREDAIPTYECDSKRSRDNPYPKLKVPESIKDVSLENIEREQQSDESFPREMLTDMGAQFTSTLMSEVSRLISLRQMTTTPYHPMCNGLVEKFNGTMKLMLKRLCAERPRNWDNYLGAALFAYREVPQEIVFFFSPFESVHGWPVRGTMTILKELWTREVTDLDKGPLSIVEKMSDLNNRIDMKGKIKMFYVNMLKLYVEREPTYMCISSPEHKVSFVATVSVIDHENEDSDGVDEYKSELIETPAAIVNETLRDVHINEALKANEIVKVQCLLNQFSHILSAFPGRTNVLQHDIKLNSDDPV